jgi:hypothetical protein
MDTQTILVSLIILAAVVYAVRRMLARLRGFSSSRSCETGCGKCATSSAESKPVDLLDSNKVKDFVQ